MDIQKDFLLREHQRWFLIVVLTLLMRMVIDKLKQKKHKLESLKRLMIMQVKP